MKKDFLEYIQWEFGFSDDEIKTFEGFLWKPLKKSIRVNTNKVSVDRFKKISSSKKWKLSETSLWNNTFYVDREDLSLALWNTLWHIIWYFYIQEVAASSSPFYLSWDKIDNENYLILDMSASPWWKTTSLSEYYPNSLIIANELQKPRLKWLFSNIDRMWTQNVVVSNYDGRFFKQVPEIFDKILLDAPCSWEWTAFKSPETIKFWNLKNIKKISKLQFWLLESALLSVKVGWEILYSTCTLNKFENEGVIEKLIKKYPDVVEILPVTERADFKRNWPHLDFTWWFFVAKIKKVKSVEWRSDNLKENVNQNIEKFANKEKKLVEDFLLGNFGFDISWKYLYKYNDKVYLTDKNLDDIWNKLFLFQIWVSIWTFKNWNFFPNFYLWTLELFEKWVIDLSGDEFDELFKGYEIEREDLTDGFYQVVNEWVQAWIWKVKWGMLKSLIDIELMRK